MAVVAAAALVDAALTLEIETADRSQRLDNIADAWMAIADAWMAAVAAWAMDNDSTSGPIEIAVELELEIGNTDWEDDHLVYGLGWTDMKNAC